MKKEKKEKKEKKDPWRPTKFEDRFHEMLIEHMTQGLNYTSFAGVIGISKDTLYGWERNIEGFSDSKKIAQAKFEEFWMKAARNGSLGKIKNFNATSWIFLMKNCMGWKSNPEVSITVNNLSQLVADVEEDNDGDEE